LGVEGARKNPLKIVGIALTTRGGGSGEKRRKEFVRGNPLNPTKKDSRLYNLVLRPGTNTAKKKTPARKGVKKPKHSNLHAGDHRENEEQAIVGKVRAPGWKSRGQWGTLGKKGKGKKAVNTEKRKRGLSVSHETTNRQSKKEED